MSTLLRANKDVQLHLQCSSALDAETCQVSNFMQLSEFGALLRTNTVISIALPNRVSLDSRGAIRRLHDRSSCLDPWINGEDYRVGRVRGSADRWDAVQLIVCDSCSRHIVENEVYSKCRECDRTSLLPFLSSSTVPQLFYRSSALLPSISSSTVPQLFYRPSALMPSLSSSAIPQPFYHPSALLPSLS